MSDFQRAGRHENGMWVPGRSGNPAGRPPARLDVAEMCRRLGPKCIRKLDALLDSEDDRVAMAALVYAMDRGFGKPVQAIASPDEATSLTFLHLVAMRAFSDELHATRTIDVEHTNVSTAPDANTGVSTPRNLMEPATE